MKGTRSPKHKTVIWRIGALAVILFSAAVATTNPTSASTDDILPSIVRGGRLYDNWYKEAAEPAPTERHPAYPSDMTYANAPESNWRCTECHGWDYLGRHGAYSQGKHFTGIKGIRGMAGADPAAIIAVVKDDTHAYNGLMKEQDFQDLANFVSLGQVDMDKFIDRASGHPKGDKTKRESYYETICAACHSRDGLKVRTMPPLGKVAKDNPWKALHTILNGHSGENMPALRVLGMGVLVDILAYIQTLPTDSFLPSVVRGGRLYDNWHAERGILAPTEPHPAYPIDKGYANQPKMNWRCKECHGWDYLGRHGAYSQGKHFTGIKGIRGMAGADPAAIIAVLKDERHGYTGLLDEYDLRDLANFVSLGQVDMDKFIDRSTKLARGDPKMREAHYKTICAACHGKHGLKMTTMPPLGMIARNNPWEALHKILNGHPDEHMPALRALDKAVLVDILAFIQTLPEER